MAKARRTTHRSSAGKKLYAVRDARGRFKDIQTYERAHRADIKRKAAEAEERRSGCCGLASSERLLYARESGCSNATFPHLERRAAEMRPARFLTVQSSKSRAVGV